MGLTEGTRKPILLSHITEMCIVQIRPFFLKYSLPLYFLFRRVLLEKDRLLLLKTSNPQPVKIDLNKKLDPKQKTIQIFNIDAKKFRKIKKENPPTQEIIVTS